MTLLDKIRFGLFIFTTVATYYIVMLSGSFANFTFTDSIEFLFYAGFTAAAIVALLPGFHSNSFYGFLFGIGALVLAAFYGIYSFAYLIGAYTTIQNGNFGTIELLMYVTAFLHFFNILTIKGAVMDLD